MIKNKERMLAFKISKEFTKEDLITISGGAKTTSGAGGTQKGTHNPQTGRMDQDTYFDAGADF